MYQTKPYHRLCQPRTLNTMYISCVNSKTGKSADKPVYEKIPFCEFGLCMYMFIPGTGSDDPRLSCQFVITFIILDSIVFILSARKCCDKRSQILNWSLFLNTKFVSLFSVAKFFFFLVLQFLFYYFFCKP